jgi:hypothetical protein
MTALTTKIDRLSILICFVTAERSKKKKADSAELVGIVVESVGRKFPAIPGTAAHRVIRRTKLFLKKRVELNPSVTFTLNRKVIVGRVGTQSRVCLRLVSE